MERKIVFLTFFLGLALFGCTKKENEIIEPKITNDNVEVTSTSASFTWTVDWVGKRISVVEVSEDVDMNNSQFYGSEEEINTSSFSTAANDLKPATKYYYRFWVWNQNYANNRFVFEKKSFSTPSDLPIVKTLDVININRTSATVQGEVISDGGTEITERGICWGTDNNPTITGNHISDEEGIGTYSFEITELIADETYYVRAYAKNKVGTAYGEEKSFTTGDAVLPTVTTFDVTNISWTTAKGGGEVSHDGDADVTERGICWSTSNNPTINDNTVQSGLGIGEFTVNMNGLIAGTTYYVKAYAKNRVGVGYGEEKTFSTSNPELPTVITKPITDITSTSAKSGGNVTFAGGVNILERGICWSTNHLPTTTDTHISSGSGTGSYNSNITGLTAGTTYYVRAYAINVVGTSYGDEETLTTETNGVLPGLFSVSASQKVYFSRGNLQYRATTNTWRFAENQYDYIGVANNNVSQTYNGWIDLFGWGTSGYNHGATCYNPWCWSQWSGDYYAYGSSTYNLFNQTGQADWGYNSIINGGNSINMWRTLTKEEWEYIINTRGTLSGIRYVKAQVDTNNGIIILPDDWNVSIYSFNSANTANSSFDSNIISVSQWSILENAGAVFLPAAGLRNGKEVNNVYIEGNYWSASCSDIPDNVYCFYFIQSNVNMARDRRELGESVRLVQDYQQ